MKKGIIAALALCSMVVLMPACGKKDSKKKAPKPAAAKKVPMKKPAAPVKK